MIRDEAGRDVLDAICGTMHRMGSGPVWVDDWTLVAVCPECRVGVITVRIPVGGVPGEDVLFTAPCGHGPDDDE